MTDTGIIISLALACTLGLFFYFNARDLIAVARILFWLTVGLFMALLNRYLPALRGEYVFKKLIVLPRKNESSRTIDKKIIYVENPGKTLHSITVIQSHSRKSDEKKEEKCMNLTR